MADIRKSKKHGKRAKKQGPVPDPVSGGPPSPCLSVPSQAGTVPSRSGTASGKPKDPGRAAHLVAFQWQKGCPSPNPSGRPSRRPFTAELARLAEQPVPEAVCRKVRLPKGTTYAEALALILFGRAITDGRLDSAREIMDRVEGTPCRNNGEGEEQEAGSAGRTDENGTPLPNRVEVVFRHGPATQKPEVPSEALSALNTPQEET